MAEPSALLYAAPLYLGNEFLLAHLRQKIDDPRIILHNVNSLAREILADDSLSLSEIIPFFEDYFAHSFDDATWRYPHIVVDEGQDLSDALLEHLSLLAALYDGSFYVFYDRNQYIMQKKWPEWIDKNAEYCLVLHKNCRNTAEIAASVGTIMNLAPKSYVNDIPA